MDSELIPVIKRKLQSIGWNWSDIVIEALLDLDGQGDELQAMIGKLLREADNVEHRAERIVALIQKSLDIK